MKPYPLAGAVLAVLALVLVVLLLREGARPRAVLEPPETPAAGEGPGTGLEAPDVRTGGESLEREALPAAAAPEKPAGPAGRAEEDLATLRVRVVAVETGAPVSDVRLALSPLATRGIVRGVLDASEARLGEAPRTDAGGEAVYTVPPGSYRLRVQGKNGLFRDLADVQSRELEVRDLSSGEEREVTVQVLTGVDLAFHGRVVDGETGSPIEGVRVSILHPDIVWKGEEMQDGDEELVALVSDADGRFEAAVPSWKLLLARVEGRGYSLLFVPVTAGHESPGEARVVPLARASSLHAEVVENGAPATGITVSLSRRIDVLVQREAGEEAWYDHVPLTWSATTGPEGACTLGELPGRVPLEVRLLRDGVDSGMRVTPLVLEPGEVREETWSFGGGASIVGVATDQHGHPVTGIEIWLDRAEPGRPARRFASYDRNISARVRTDDQGRFRFDDVPAGDWWIGPGESKDARAPDEPAPVAERITILEGESEHRVTLAVFRGLFVSGSVLDPDGRPVSTAVYTFGWDHAFTRSREDGTFVLGPLAPGEYTLKADEAEGFRSSEPVQVAAAAEDVVLRLRPGASLRGRIVGAVPSFDGMSVTLAADRLDDVEGGYVDEEEVRDDGTFQFNALAPGGYAIFARSPAGDVGIVRGVEVEANPEPTEVLVRMESGGRLRVRTLTYPAAEEYVVLLQDGHYLAQGSLRAGGSGYEISFLAPPGPCTVRLIRPADQPGDWQFIEKAVTVLAGEEAVVRLEPEAGGFREGRAPGGD